MPRELPRATANVLNGLAFEARKTDIDILKQNLIIRNPRFLESSIQVQKARPGRIEQQIAYTGSVKRERFTGWQEQEHGDVPRRHTASIKARGSKKRGKIKTRARFLSKNKFWKPEQFQGKNLQQRFYFMMRVLGSRGGQQAFILSQKIPTKSGALGRGLYILAGHKISRMRERQDKHTQRLPWNEMMIRTLGQRQSVRRLWYSELIKITQRGYKI